MGRRTLFAQRAAIHTRGAEVLVKQPVAQLEFQTVTSKATRTCLPTVSKLSCQPYNNNSVYRYRSRQDGLPVIQEWYLVEQLRQQLGPWRAPCRVWHGGWQRLLEGKKFLGYYVWRERLRTIAPWQGRIW